MRNPKDGVALAAIVASETTDGQWSGTGGGLGLGTGGTGLFVGGMSGTKREQTQQAKEFETPPRAAYNWKYVFGPLIAILAGGILFSFSSQFTLFMAENRPPASSDRLLDHAADNLMPVVNMLGTLVPIVAVISAVVWLIFFCRARENEETARLEAERAKNQIRETIYYRLRYVEVDHVVFAPESMEEVPAHREAILKLIEKLTLEISK